MIPKLHFLAHLAINIHQDLCRSNPVLNPSVFATPMAEDYVGEMCKMSMHVNPSLVAKRGLERYLVRARRAWLKEDAERSHG